MGMHKAMNKKIIMPELTLREWRDIQYSVSLAASRTSIMSYDETNPNKRASLEKQIDKLYELRKFISALIDPLVEEAMWS